MIFITSILSWFASNPLMILGAIGIWVATGWISDVKGYFAERSLAAGYTRVIEERDQIAAKKDAIIVNALQEREKINAELSQLQAHLDDAEIARKTAGVPDCVWSRDDIRLLNTSKSKRR